VFELNEFEVQAIKKSVELMINKKDTSEVWHNVFAIQASRIGADQDCNISIAVAWRLPQPKPKES
jgi:hypothetical protein